VSVIKGVGVPLWVPEFEVVWVFVMVPERVPEIVDDGVSVTELVIDELIVVDGLAMIVVELVIVPVGDPDELGVREAVCDGVPVIVAPAVFDSDNVVVVLADKHTEES